MRKKVLIGGVIYGRHNIGDEAILESMIRSFRATVDLTVMSCDSMWVQEKFPDVIRKDIPVLYGKPKLGLYAYPRKKLFSAFKNTFFPDLKPFKEYDVMLCGGGTILSDSAWHSLHSIEVAKKAGLPTIMWAVGMAEVRDASTRKYIERVCNSDNVLKIFTRDEYVMQRLIAYGVDAQKIDVCYDPVYMLEADEDPDFSFLNENEQTLYYDERPNVCISLAGEPDVTDESHVKHVQAYVEALTKTANVFLVPTGFSSACTDRELLSTLAINEYVVLIQEELQPTQLIAFLQKMELIVSSRLHCSIFGAVAGVPSINIMRNEKNRDFATMFRLPALPMEDVSAMVLQKLTEEMFGQRENLQKTINAVIQELRKKHQRAIETVVDIIS